MRISDWSSDVCSSDLTPRAVASEQIFARDLPRIAGRDILDDEANAGLANARKPCAQTKAHLDRGTRRHRLAQRRLEMWLHKADIGGPGKWIRRLGLDDATQQHTGGIPRSEARRVGKEG